MYDGYYGHRDLDEYNDKAFEKLPLVPLVPEGMSMIELIEYLKINAYGILRLGGAETADESASADCPCLYNKFGEPLHSWPIGTPQEHVLADMTANGWKCEHSIFDGSYDCIHTELQEKLFRLVLEAPRNIAEALLDHEPPYEGEDGAEAKLPDAERGYIRFGELPQSGYSYNTEAGLPELGVSVYDAEITKDEDYALIRLTPTIAHTAGVYLDAELPVYRLYGEAVGYGQDGSPVLKVDKAVPLSGRFLGVW